MADIRINSLSTTASSTASDDFIAVDGTTNGTRKLNAYSPTFGGNLTASGGSITVSGGAYPNFYANGTTGGGFTIQKSGVSYGTFYGNDTNTVLDSAGSASLILQTGGATRATLTSTATTLTGNLTVSGTSGITITATNGAGLTHSTAAGSYRGLKLQTSSSDRWLIGANDAAESGSNAGSDLVVFSYSDAGTFLSSALKLVRSTGNLLVGTTTDSSNGKLQLATHTTSAGGIGFGTDWGIYRKSQYTLGINVASGAKPLFVYTDVTNVGFFDQADVNTTTGWSGYYITPGDKALKLATNNTTALTLDSSQNATFAGNSATFGASGTGGVNSQLVLKGGSGANGGGAVVYQKNGTTKAWAGLESSILGGGSTSDNYIIYTASGLAVTVDGQNTTFAGSIKTVAPSGGTAKPWELGEAATVSPTSPNRTIRVEIDGTVYYLHAKTTND